MKQSTGSKIKRRALLGAISTAGIVGVAKLPGQWARPVVDHVLLPAHAATTDDTGAIGTGVSTFITTVTSNCVVTCTSAYDLYIQRTQAHTAIGSEVFLYSNYTSYSQCSDPFGGFSTSAFSSYSCSFVSLTGASDYSTYCGSSSYTATAICNVTVTSS